MNTEDVSASLWIGSIALAVAVIGLVFALGSFTAAADAQRNTTAECVVRVAHEQGYHGDPHSQEAWSLFAPSC